MEMSPSRKTNEEDSQLRLPEMERSKVLEKTYKAFNKK